MRLPFRVVCVLGEVPDFSQRSTFEQVTASEWLAQMDWMWHEARQVVAALRGSDAHPPRSAKLTHVSEVSCRIESFSEAKREHEALHCCSMKAGLR